MVVGRGGEGGRTSQPADSLSISPLFFFFFSLLLSSSDFYFLPQTKEMGK
jgi:hypothetical protein